MQFRYLACGLMLGVGLCGCGGGGGGGGSDPDPVVPSDQHVRVTRYWDPPANSAIKEVGMVAVDSAGAPTDQREGRWEFTFPPTDGGKRQATRFYVRGNWDKTEQWREWNADGSTRYDWQDR